MGTVEHFDDTDGALREIFRVTRPGGTAIVGVPNRRDPFLRSLFVALHCRIGLSATASRSPTFGPSSGACSNGPASR